MCPGVQLAPTRPWLLLTAAAVFQTVWIVSVKLMDGLSRLLPLTVYLASGLGAAVCLSFAMKTIPMGTAYAVWMGASLVGAVVIGCAFFDEPWSAFRGVCVLLIVAGVCGPRVAAAR